MALEVGHPDESHDLRAMLTEHQVFAVSVSARRSLDAISTAHSLCVECLNRWVVHTTRRATCMKCVGVTTHRALRSDGGSIRKTPQTSNDAINQPTTKPAAVLMAIHAPVVMSMTKKSTRLR